VFFGSLFQAVNKSGLILKRALINVFANGVLTVLFVWWLGAWGAAVGTVGALLTFAYPYCIWYAKREYEVNVSGLFSLRKLRGVALIALAAAVGTWTIVRICDWDSPLVVLIISSLCFGCFYFSAGKVFGVVSITALIRSFKN
jgi:O-antigen/teichoic acid export membrane protein